MQVWWRSDQKWSRYRPDNIFPITCLRETKGQVTFMWIVRAALKSNSSKNLWLSSWSASRMKIRSKMKSLSSGQHFPKSMGPSRAGNFHANSRNCAEIERPIFYACPRYLQVRWFHKKNEVNIFPFICLNETKGQVTLMWIIWSGTKSNSKIL